MINIYIQLFGGRGASSRGIKKMIDHVLNEGVGSNGKNSVEIDTRDLSLREWENEIRYNNYETLILFENINKPLKAWKGNQHSVNPVVSVNFFKDKIVTHNHPNTYYGGTFSKADMQTYINGRVKEIRAVATEGTYVIKRGKNYNYLNLEKTFISTIDKVIKDANNIYIDISNKRKNELKDYTNYEFSKLRRQKFVGELHRYYKKICGKCNFNYVFIPIQTINNENKRYDALK